LIAAAATLALGGCATPPYGEVLVAVDSEPSVPSLIARLRIDLYTPDMVWYQSREVVTPDASSWPVTFGLFTDERAGKLVRVRLRAYPEGAVRDYQGERFEVPAFVEPEVAHSVTELCASPPLLPRATSMVFRRGFAPVTELTAQADCAPPTRTGSVAVRISIPAMDTYHFAVVDDSPAGRNGYPGGDTTLFLRTACADPSTQLACNDDVDPVNHVLTSEFDAALGPGTYYLVSGGKFASPADLTLRWDTKANFQSVRATPPTYGPRGRMLAVDGAATPAEEPQPSLAIDRLLDVQVDYGQLRTANVLLAGECFGTQADLFGGATCTDTAGVRAPVAHATLTGGIAHPTRSAQGSWAAERVVACAGPAQKRSAPFGGAEVYDEDVCVPGGAFKLGDARVIGITLDSIPEQMAVVEPFFLDQFEYTVARYRRAVAMGFHSPDDSPWVNDGPINTRELDLASKTPCTFSTAPMGRETLPLSCVSWYAARELCQLEGRELPGHVQWEFAATAAGRMPGEKSLWPWGDDLPTCDRTVYGRGSLSFDCIAAGGGPQPVGLEPFASADLSAAGVSALGGNIGEWTLDSMRDYRDPCWRMRVLRGVGCQEVEAPLRSSRGGAWPIASFDLRAAGLSGFSPGISNFAQGFRCARKGTP
jgi:formylglycine-generating enzyme required for sulfatase activity